VHGQVAAETCGPCGQLQIIYSRGSMCMFVYVVLHWFRSNAVLSAAELHDR